MFMRTIGPLSIVATVIWLLTGTTTAHAEHVCREYYKDNYRVARKQLEDQYDVRRRELKHAEEELRDSIRSEMRRAKKRLHGQQRKRVVRALDRELDQIDQQYDDWRDDLKDDRSRQRDQLRRERDAGLRRCKYERCGAACTEDFSYQSLVGPCPDDFYDYRYERPFAPQDALPKRSRSVDPDVYPPAPSDWQQMPGPAAPLDPPVEPLSWRSVVWSLLTHSWR